jgi:hypothetical protein
MSETGLNRAVLVAMMSLMSLAVSCKNVADISLFRLSGYYCLLSLGRI